MYFMDDERLREYERFMQHTPHYRPRGCGVIGIRIMDTKPPPAPYEERDETVYTMKVYVTNNENGPGLVSEIVLTVPGMDGKPEHIIFVNKYPTVPDDPDDPDGPQTGDSSHLWLYICLGAVSLTALVTLFLTKRRKSEQ